MDYDVFLAMPNSETHIDTLVIDYGNTLVLDPFFRILEMKSTEFQEWIKAKGYNVEWQHLARLWIIANKEIDFPFISHFYQERAIVKQALRNAGLDERDVPVVSDALLHIYRQGFKEVLSKDARRVEVKQVLISIKKKGLKLGVLSNEREFALNFGLSCYGIINLFDLVLSSEKLEAEKPDPKIFYDALEILNSKPETSIYIGDDPIRDILAAKKIGMKTVLYRPPPEYYLNTSWRTYRHPRISPDFVIEKFTELLQIV